MKQRVKRSNENKMEIYEKESAFQLLSKKIVSFFCRNFEDIAVICSA